MTLNNKILLMPSEQLAWLILAKDIFKREFNNKKKKEFINAVEHKAKEKGYIEIGLLLNSSDIEKYFKN